MTALLALIPYLFKVIAWIMDAGKAKQEQREAFRFFVDKYDTIGNGSVEQHDDVQKQLDDLKP
jgi:hypothetical protein